MAKTDEEYYNALLNMRDSKEDIVAIKNRISDLANETKIAMGSDKESHILLDRRINDMHAEAGLLKRFVESLHGEMRDIRTLSVNTQKWVEDNANVTREVRDILTSFSVISSAAKWLTTVAAAVGIIWAITQGWFKR